MKTIEEAIQAASKCLESVGIENPQIESEFLIAAFLDIPRTHLVLHRTEALKIHEIRALKSWVRERQKRKPLAYVAGSQPFRDLNLKVTPAVLVPRPETELVVEQALRMLDRLEESATVVDVGTGSGAIALCLSLHPKVRCVIGIDRSAAALKVARFNQKLIQRGTPVEWVLGNLLAPLLPGCHPRSRSRGSLDSPPMAAGNDRPSFIIANLPYVRTEEMTDLEPELHWEPRLALDGGADGLRFIEPCIQQAAEILKPGGILLLEIGADQSRAVRNLLKENARWTDIQVFSDFAGLPRMVQSRKKEY